MDLDIQPVDATFGAVVRGIKLSALDVVTFTALYDAWLNYALLIFPGQHLTREEQIALGRRFGPLEFELAPISNIRSDGTLYTAENGQEHLVVLEATNNWHTDSTYKPIHAKGAVFSAVVVPEGGTQTGWADMSAAYIALDPGMRARIDNLCAYHSFSQKQAKRGHAISAKTAAEMRERGDGTFYAADESQSRLRPLVKVHPETGRKSLLLGYHVCEIPGLSEDESERLVKDLMDFACRPPRTYHHEWSAGDAVVWDNRCLLHRSRPWDMSLPRVMWHTRLAGDPVTEAALP